MLERKDRVENFMSEVKDSFDGIELPDLPRLKSDPKNPNQIKIGEDKLRKKFYKGLGREDRIQLAVGLVNEMYEVVLGRKPTTVERRGKVNVLVQGGTREGIYHSLILGDEYRVREQQSIRALSKKNNHFSLYYLKKYLGLTVDKWEQDNFFVLKKIITEKTLDLVDAFEKRHDVNRWFAVFSEDLEQKLSWRQGHRKLGDRNTYMLWSTNIPLDILKSEIVIKIHHLMNALQ